MIEELGMNAWFAEEIYQTYLSNPASVDEGWRSYFAENGRPNTATRPIASKVAPPAAEQSANGTNANGSGSTNVVTSKQVASPEMARTEVAQTRAVEATPEPAAGNGSSPSASGLSELATPLRGAAGRIVANMIESLTVPTATSVHPVPAKLLEVNRAIVNTHLSKVGKKVSFTHLIAFAVLKGLKQVPVLNSSFVASLDSKSTPGVVRHEHVGLGIAIDLTRSSGEHSLVVPAIRDADLFTFPQFVDAYEALVNKARTNSLTVEDFAGVTLTITNPGTLGTTQSVPRLMSGQGAIIGIGALDYPAEFGATDPARLSELAIGKVVVLTSTYDHRVIQGAESGLFLKYVHELLVGEHGFYEDLFAALEITEVPARWGRDILDRTAPQSTTDLQKQIGVVALIEAYRRSGHLIADLDPLKARRRHHELPAELDPSTYGLTVWDYDRSFRCDGLSSLKTATLSEILDTLKSAYCGTIAVEASHIQDVDERCFIESWAEGPFEAFEESEKRYILERLTASDSFERFLHVRYVGQKRFGLEGADSTIPFLDAVLARSESAGATEAVLGMAHRGRLNVLANVIGKPYSEIFADFEGSTDATTVAGSGDVKYHKGASGKWVGRDGASIPITMLPNPSHLETVNAVAEGVARAKTDRVETLVDHPIVTILIHGDASFSGQGVVAELFNLSRLEGYEIGGAIHLIINNQVGFTTPPESGRSTIYPSDIAKGVEAPIIHVNGDYPEAVAAAGRLCVAYRERFHKDIVVDLVCYRLHGHNEGDDPSYTQPLMYKAIEAHTSVRDLYASALIEQNVVTGDDADAERTSIVNILQGELDAVRALEAPHYTSIPERPTVQLPSLSMSTGVDRNLLDRIERRFEVAPDGFTIHPKLERQLVQRGELYASGEVDWAHGEALAYGSLVLEGTDVRLVGQDTRRGTFSHRHSVLLDYENGAEFTPLGSLGDQVADEAPLSGKDRLGRFEVRDSLLSEYAALGFEYGYSTENKDALVIWEAQFGDFANGAQIVIDNYMVAGEEKWGLSSGLVMLLPHGYEGQGPEHSSARIERYLELCAGGNITVAQPTTAAQFFHLLRAQAHRTLRRPLVVIAPKSILRARQSRSSIDELVGGTFHEVLGDVGVTGSPADVGRIVMCSGKIAFEAMERRDKMAAAVAVVRLEQLYPFPDEGIRNVLRIYPNATEVVWLQDEPANMGSWSYLADRLRVLVDGELSLSLVSRRPSGSPATGSHHVHDLEVQDLLARSVGPVPS